MSTRSARRVEHPRRAAPPHDDDAASLVSASEGTQYLPFDSPLRLKETPRRPVIARDSKSIPPPNLPLQSIEDGATSQGSVRKSAPGTSYRHVARRRVAAKRRLEALKALDVAAVAVLDCHREAQLYDDDNDDDGWRGELNYYKTAFEAYHCFYLEDGGAYLSIEALIASLDEQNRLPADAGFERTVARTLARTNVASLLNDFTDPVSSEEAQSELQSLDQNISLIIPATLLPEESRQPLFEQALATRTQRAIATAARYSHEFPPAHCVASAFCAIAEAKSVIECEKALKDGPYLALGGRNLQDESSGPWRLECQRRIDNILALLGGRSKEDGIDALRSAYPFVEYRDGLRAWAMTALAAADADPRSTSPLFVDARDRFDTSQSDSLLGSELSHSIVRQEAAPQ